MALVISSVTAAAIMLPRLIVSVWAFRCDFSARNLAILIAAFVIGVGLGWLLAARINEDVVRSAVGLISTLFVLRDRLGAVVERPSASSGVCWGLASRLTSFTGHSGAPRFQIYVMPQKLQPKTYAGTSTMVFAVINLLKALLYFFLGQLSWTNLIASHWLVPVAIGSALAGVWFVRRVAADRFYAIILVLTFLIGVKLAWDASVAIA